MAPLVKNSPANAGDIRNEGLIPASGRSPGGGHGNPLQYFPLDSCPPLFSSSILDTFRPGRLIFRCRVFFCLSHCSRGSHSKNTGVVCCSLLQWEEAHVLSELFTMTCPPWAALHGMAHSFTELSKPLCQDKAVIHEGAKTITLSV